MRDLREYIAVVEDAWTADEPPVELSEPELVESVDAAARLADLVFKLRAHSEPLCESVGDSYSLGVEAGCEMAAEMLENLIRQLGGENSND